MYWIISLVRLEFISFVEGGTSLHFIFSSSVFPEQITLTSSNNTLGSSDRDLKVRDVFFIYLYCQEETLNHYREYILVLETMILVISVFECKFSNMHHKNKIGLHRFADD